MGVGAMRPRAGWLGCVVIPAAVLCMLVLPASAFGFFETPSHSGSASGAGAYVAAAAGIIAVVGVGGMGVRNLVKSRRMRQTPNPVSGWSRDSRVARSGGVDGVVRRVSADNPSDVVTSGPPARADVADELTKLADLRDRGVLTQAEFDVQKDKLLGPE